MMNMMKDLDGAEMNKQLETLGLSPSEVINKIMAEPELAAAFQKPKVMQVTSILCKSTCCESRHKVLIGTWQLQILQRAVGCAILGRGIDKAA